MVSYLTPLTGLTAALIDERGVPLEEAIRVLRSRLPSSAALVGTNIGQDAKWLGLTAPGDCALLVDLAALFRAWDGSRCVYFSQDHCAKVWLGAVRPPKCRPRRRRGCGRVHGSPGLLYEDAGLRKGAVPRAGLSDAARPSFAVKHPSFEGVCPGESAALYLWRAALLVSVARRALASWAAPPRGDGAVVSSTPSTQRRSGDDGVGSTPSRWTHRRGAVEQRRLDAPPKKKNVFDRPLSEEYTRKTDGRRRPMPQQIWKGPEIKINDAPPRRLTSAAARATPGRRRALCSPFSSRATPLLAASLVYAGIAVQRAIGDGGEKSRMRSVASAGWASLLAMTTSIG